MRGMRREVRGREKREKQRRRESQSAEGEDEDEKASVHLSYAFPARRASSNDGTIQPRRGAHHFRQAMPKNFERDCELDEACLSDDVGARG